MLNRQNRQLPDLNSSSVFLAIKLTARGSVIVYQAKFQYLSVIHNLSSWHIYFVN